MHAGTFGQLLEFATGKPAPELHLPQQELTDYGRIIMRGYFAGATPAEMRASSTDNVSAKQHQRASRKLYDLYGAQTSSHFIRRVVEKDGRARLPSPRITYENQRDLAYKLSPRKIVYLGLLSYGLEHSTIENLFDEAKRTVDKTIGNTKAGLNLPHKTTEFVLAQFFADNVLKPDKKPLPHTYVVASLTAIRRSMHTFVFPRKLLPEGPYPWAKTGPSNTPE